MPERYLIGQDRFRKAMRNVASNQLPFALAVGLTKTAQDVQKELTAELPRSLDRPTPFTRRAFTVKAASKRAPVAYVNTRPIQAAYLLYQVRGGVRTPARNSIVVPFQTRLNRYGNMTRNKIRQLLARKDTFSGVVKGIPGIWQRPKRTKRNPNPRPKLLVAYEKQVQYQPRFPFNQVASRTALGTIVKNMKRGARQAIRTAR